MYGLAAKKYGSQLAGHQKNAHVHTHARTHIHTTPFFCSFWKELCLPGDWRQQRRPWYSWSSASKRREKRVKGRFEVQPEKRSGEGASGGRSGQGNGPVVGRRECGRERRSWQSQLEKVKNTSGKQLQPDSLRSAERVKLHPNSCPPGRTAGPLTRWSRALRDQRAPQKDSRREKRGEGEGRGGGGERRGGGCEWEEAAEACGTSWGRLLVQLSVFPPSQTSSGVETASLECSASVAKVRPLKT